MQKLRLDLEDLTVSSFETAALHGGVMSAAIAVRQTDPTPRPDPEVTTSCDTNEFACLATTMLAEDCFGPTAGCPLNTGNDCPDCTYAAA